jgi:hypothetical protein
MLESLVIGLTSVKMEIYKTSDRKKTSLEGEYGRHSLVGNYFDCVGNCADYLVVPKSVEGQASGKMFSPHTSANKPITT